MIQRYIAISKFWIQCLFFQKHFHAHFLGQIWSPIVTFSKYWKFGTGVHCYMLITILIFIFPKFWSLMFFWEIWSRDPDSSKLTEILLRGRLIYAYFNFDIYFFKIFVIYIFWANLVSKSEVLQVNWNLIYGYIGTCLKF